MNTLKSKSFAFDSDKKKIALMIVVLLGLNIILYINTVSYDFLKDDFRLIVENPRVKDFQSFMNSLGSKFFAFPDFPYLHYWRPLTLFSFYADYQLWGVNPSGYHLFNILINAANGLLVFLVIYVLFKQIHYAFLGSLFFSIHPCHVEAVSWISGRTDLLAAFFIFTAVLFFILFLKKRKIPLYVLTAFFFILALLSKENSALFPLLAVGLVFMVPVKDRTDRTNGTNGTDRTDRPDRINWKRGVLLTIPFWMVDFGYVVVHNRFSGVQGVVENFSFKDIFIIIKTIGAYTKVILTPFFPTPHFSMHHFDGNHPEYLVYFVAAVGILVFMWLNREKYKYSLYSLLFFIFLLPVLDPEIVPSYPKIVIRFAYIPALFAGIFFLDTIRFFRNKRLKGIFTGLLVFVGVVWAVEAFTFQDYYKDQHHHYNGLTQYYPEDCSLLLPRALITAQDGDFQKALELVNHALEVNDKDRWLDISEMGGLLKANLLVITGDYEKGKSLAEKILGDTSKDEMKYFGYIVLSRYHDKTANLPAALDMLKKAGNIGETADLFFRTALVYAKMNHFSRALHYVDKAIDLNPAIKKYWEFKDFLLDLQKRGMTDND
jgi:tetratricopeptide (TPR) repeat protein